MRNKTDEKKNWCNWFRLWPECAMCSMHYCCIGQLKQIPKMPKNMHVYRNYFITALIEMFRVQSFLSLFFSLILHISCVLDVCICNFESLFLCISLSLSHSSSLPVQILAGMCHIFMRVCECICVCVHFCWWSEEWEFCLIL